MLNFLERLKFDAAKAEKEFAMRDRDAGIHDLSVKDWEGEGKSGNK